MLEDEIGYLNDKADIVKWQKKHIKWQLQGPKQTVKSVVLSQFNQWSKRTSFCPKGGHLVTGIPKRKIRTRRIRISMTMRWKKEEDHLDGDALGNRKLEINATGERRRTTEITQTMRTRSIKSSNFMTTTLVTWRKHSLTCFS